MFLKHLLIRFVKKEPENQNDFDLFNSVAFIVIVFLPQNSMKVLSALLLLLVISVSARKCSFSDKSGKFDLSALDKTDLEWAKPYTSTVFHYRPCSPLSYKCGNFLNAALCEKDNNGNHHSLGSLDETTFASMDAKKGLTLTHRGGQLGCGTVQRSTKVECLCNKAAEGKIVEVVEHNDQGKPCTYTMYMESKYCCGKSSRGFFGTFFLVLLWVILLAAAYVGGASGFLYFVKGMRGTDAVAHYPQFKMAYDSIFQRQQYTAV
ncbi:hypothetical protein RCL1_009130 [Eukaryota sp. TZLM3-RCL]